MANVTRSPLMEGILKSLLEKANITTVLVDSAGYRAFVGSEPNARCQSVAGGYGIKLDHRSRLLVGEDFELFDRILVADCYLEEQILRAFEGKMKSAQVQLLSRYYPESDPRYGKDIHMPQEDESGYQSLYTCIEELCQRFIAREYT